MIIIAVLFITLGIAIKYGKMYFLIAGYNTMSKEKQAEYNIEAIASLFRNAMFGMALIIILGYLLTIWLEDSQYENIAFFLAMIIGIPYLLINSNSEKYKTKKKS